MASCTDLTLFNDLIVGKIDDSNDPCSTQLSLKPAPNDWGTVQAGMIGINATGMNITTFNVTKLPDEAKYLDLRENKLATLPSFAADSLNQLYIYNNLIASFHDINVPSSLIELGLKGNQMDKLVNVTLPENLIKLGLDWNKITEIKGVKFPKGLKEFYFAGNPIKVFEIAHSDVRVFEQLQIYGITINQTTCEHTTNPPQTIGTKNGNSTFCVIDDDVWDSLYAPSTTNPSSNPAASSTNGSSSSAMYIGIGVGAVVLVLLIVGLIIGCRRRREPENGATTKNTFGTTMQGATVEAGESEYKSFMSPTYHRPNFDVWDDPVFRNATIPLKVIHEEKLLGKGAFGEVYKGTCNDRAVAIKKLKKDFTKNDKYVQSFIQEAKLMAVLEHPNIVEFIGIAGDNLTNMIVIFEFMDRGDLRSVLAEYKSQSLPTGFTRERLKIAFNIANALTYLHSMEPKVLHRDLKSHNVLLNEQMEAKLTDFGISRQQSTDMTVGIGTMRWMAPEVMMSDQYDEKADIFSFGVMLSELDTLELPYANQTDDRGRKLAEPALLERISRGAISVKFTETKMPELVQLARECVALDPESRPAAAAVSYRLQQLLKNYTE